MWVLFALLAALAGAVLAITGDRATSARRPSVRDERRITMAVRRIEAQAEGIINPNVAIAPAAGFHDLAVPRRQQAQCLW